MSTLGDNIKALRESLGMTQEELGKQVGVTGVTIMRYEKGQREPSLLQIWKLGKALHTDPVKLVGWKNVSWYQRLREEKGLSVEDLSEKSGIPLETLLLYDENPDCIPNADLEKLLSACGITVKSVDLAELARTNREQFHKSPRYQKLLENRLSFQEQKRENRLEFLFLLLNETGQKVAIQRLMELAQIPAYQNEAFTAEMRADTIKFCEE